MTLTPGTAAPDFSLHSTPDQAVSLREFRGQPVILAFYPADWSPVCGDQMALYNEILREFQRLNAELIGISVDGIWCHLAFAHDRKLRFPLLSDFEPKGEVAARLRRVSRTGRHQRARLVRDRRERHHPLELRVAGRHQSGRRRHSARARSASKVGRGNMADMTMKARHAQTVPVTDRDHAQGSADCSSDARRIRRLRVPALRPGLPDRAGASSSTWASGLRFVFRNFPLTTIHPHAQNAAEAAEAAGAQGKFWEMHDCLFEHQRRAGRRRTCSNTPRDIGARRRRGS